MSSNLRRCCTISRVVIGRPILTCTSSTHRTEAESPIRVAAPERSMASVDCQGSDHESDTWSRAHTTWDGTGVRMWYAVVGVEYRQAVRGV
jgi:hypothetical protein